MTTMEPGISPHIDKLREDIEHGMVDNIYRRRFLPNNKLHEILTLDAIKNAVKELPFHEEDRIGLPNRINNEGKRIFAMLIYNHWQHLFIKFLKRKLLDNRLPLSEDDAAAITSLAIGRRLARETQWAFCPYEFQANMYENDEEIEEQMILPIIGAEEAGNGAFGNVEKITISPSQQNFMDKKAAEVIIARKMISGDIHDFEKEKRNLRLLNQRRHPNIVPLLGFYTYGDKYNFLFPYFDMDLGRFLKAESRHHEFQWDATFYSALTGLASALSEMHNLDLNEADHDIDFKAIGYHHDLRPPNVLVSTDSFVLADFGLGRLKGAEELSQTEFKWNGGWYAAPESHDMERKPLPVGRPIDVWAFGCLVAEVITYMLKGVVGVQEFSARRLQEFGYAWHSHYFHNAQGSLKNEVVEWMKMLTKENPSPDLIPQLIKISLDALEPNPKARPPMADLHRRLADLSIKKHFGSIQDIFREIQTTIGEQTSVGQNDQMLLKYAQPRFEAWGHALDLNKCDASIHLTDQPEKYIEVMKTLSGRLRKVSNKQDLEEGSKIVEEIDELWNLLPTELEPVAQEGWGLRQQTWRLHDAQALSVQDSHRDRLDPSTPKTSLQTRFKEAALYFKDSLPRSIQAKLDDIPGTTSVTDVYNFTESIQEEQKRREKLRHLSKIEIYLTRLHEYATNINFIICGDSSILTLIWRPIVLLLRESKIRDDAFDSVVNAFAVIGQSLPDFKALPPVADLKTESHEITIWFFQDILSFYREAFQLFDNPSWGFDFNHWWPSCHAGILTIEGRLERLSVLLAAGVLEGAFKKEHELRKGLMGYSQAQSVENPLELLSCIRTTLNPCDYDTTLEQLEDLRCDQTGAWLFESQPYKDWETGSQADTQILWLKGIPGAGRYMYLLRCLFNILRAFGHRIYIKIPPLIVVLTFIQNISNVDHRKDCSL
ncbi:kinase-like domain-containing protein [Nemania sp. NC0429]|nr:kinase-like domain-containing protein [Nemania sp. NC0429]